MKRFKIGTIIFIAFILAMAVYVTALVIDSNRRADQMIHEVDILTDGMGR